MCRHIAQDAVALAAKETACMYEYEYIDFVVVAKVAPYWSGIDICTDGFLFVMELLF